MVKEKPKYETIEKFIQRYGSKYTQKTYRTQLYKYFDILGVNPDKYFTSNKTKKDYEDDIWKFANAIQNIPPKSRIVGIATVKKFLERYDIDFKKRFWDDVNNKFKGRWAVTNDKIPTNQQLRQILQHADVKGKALFLTLASSGMRIGEALQLKVDKDLQLDTEPPSIDIKWQYTKTGASRTVFISNEAKESILEWLKVRDKYVESTAQKCEKHNETRKKKRKKQLFGFKSEKDNRLFPYVGNVAQVQWRNCIKKAGFVERDNNTHQERYKFHIHGLRKFFSTRMSIASVPESFIEYLLGHSDGIRGIYKDYSLDEKATLYKKGLENLLIFETSVDRERLTEVEEKLKKYDKLFEKIDPDILVELFRKNSPLIEEIRESYRKQGRRLWIPQNKTEENKKYIEELKNSDIDDKPLTDKEKKKLIKEIKCKV